MSRDLKDILNSKGGSSPPAAKPPAHTAPAEPAAQPVNDDAVDAIVEHVEGIEVEAVVGGALQRIRLRAGVNPAQVGAMLKALDPNAEVRSEFPRRGSFGSRETKTARVLVINARVTDSGAFIDLVSQNGEDMSIAVSKKGSATFIDSVKALGKVSEKHLSKLEKAWAEKGSATVILPEPEQFGVQYWTTDDGKAFMDSLVAEPPPAAPAEDKEDDSNG